MKQNGAVGRNQAHSYWWYNSDAHTLCILFHLFTCDKRMLCYCVWYLRMNMLSCINFVCNSNLVSKLQYSVSLLIVCGYVCCAMPLVLSPPPPPANRMSDAKLQKQGVAMRHPTFQFHILYFPLLKRWCAFLNLLFFFVQTVTVFSIHDECYSPFDERRDFMETILIHFNRLTLRENHEKRRIIIKKLKSLTRDSSSSTSGGNGNGGGGANIFSLTATFSLEAQRIISNQ